MKSVKGKNKGINSCVDGNFLIDLCLVKENTKEKTDGATHGMCTKRAFS